MPREKRSRSGTPSRKTRAALAVLAGWTVLAAATVAAPVALAVPPPAGALTGAHAPMGPIPPQADPGTDLAVAEKFYSDLDYDRANLVAARVAAGKGLSHSDQAREEFIEILTYSADFQVDPNLGPRVTAPFLEARGYWRAQPEKPGIEVTATVHADGPGTLRVVTRDPTHILKSGTVGFRWGTSVPYQTLPLTISGGEGMVIDVPERPANIARLDYYAQAVDERGNTVMEVGNATAPKSAVVDVDKPVIVAAKPEGRSIFASPIFWAVTGAVVAGAAVTTYLVTRPRTPTGANLTGAAGCGSSDMASMPAAACR